MSARRAAGALVVLVLVAGCGSDAGPKAPPGVPQSEFKRQLADAGKVAGSDFPGAGGRALQSIADTTAGGTQLGLATSVLVPGTQRLAFGCSTKTTDSSMARAPSISPALRAPRHGAPTRRPPTRSSPKAPTAAAQPPPRTARSRRSTLRRFPSTVRAGYAVLVVTKQGSRMRGAASEVEVRADQPNSSGRRAAPRDRYRHRGQCRRQPRSHRHPRPPARHLHEKSFKEVLGRQPVALLFATPQLCQSRVCGPVVDIELQLSREYSDRVAFIHQEVYKDNKVEKGLRAPLRAFHLQTEPWLFTFDRRGRVAARLEGSFGINDFRRAIEAALR